MQEKSSSTGRPKVIVRSWGNEPVPLYLHRITNNRAYVGQEGSDMAIGLPISDVFSFDAAAFESLAIAYRSGDNNKLSSMYSELGVNSPCNRYQDNLKSPHHDKENITDSRSPKSGREQ